MHGRLDGPARTEAVVDTNDVDPYLDWTRYKGSQGQRKRILYNGDGFQDVILVVSFVLTGTKIH